MKKLAMLRILTVVTLFLFLTFSVLSVQVKRANAEQGPVASFVYSPDIPTPGETVLFDASSSYDSYGSIVTYAWDFGDGSAVVMTTPTITHSYALDGTYTVQLIVIDDSGSTGAATAVVSVNCVTFFRVVRLFSLAPMPGVEVTAYTNQSGTWTKAPVSQTGFEIKYDNMTQPNLANTNAQKYRNPGYTASILRSSASNIGFDAHQSGWYVYFKFTWQNYTSVWPNAPSQVLTYKNGNVETHYYSSGHGAVWDAAAQTYVIRVNHIADNGVAPTEDHPILVALSCPMPVQQYYLTVRTDPAGITTIPGQGSYNNGTNAVLTAPTYVNVSANTRYRFNNWDVDGVSYGSTNPLTVLMIANHTATAHYVLQYLVTFAQTGLSTGATGTVVTVGGGGKGYSDLPYTLWIDNGASVTYSYNSIVTSSVTGQQFRLASVSGPSTPITITAPVTVTGNYVTQYLVTFIHTGLDSTATGTVVTINGTAKTYSSIPYILWVDSGSSVTYSYGSVVASSVSGKQFRLNSVTGSSSPITVTGPSTVAGNYVVQYLVTFAQTGLDSTASGAIVTVNGNPKIFSTLPYAFWVDSGSSVTYSYGSVVASSVSGKQFRLNSVTGSSSPITVTGPNTITGNYVMQYQVTFGQTGLDSTATGTVVTVNSNTKAFGDMPYTLWVDSGSSVTYSYGSVVASSVSGKQFRLNSVTGSSSPITVTGPSTVAGNYVVQYYLTVTSAHGSPSPSSGWSDSGTVITEAVTSPVSGGSGIQYVCTGWTGTGSVPSSGGVLSVTFTINAPSTITWNWKTQYYLTVTSVYDSPSPVSGWFDSGSGITESVTSPVSGGSGIQYVCTGWTGTGSVPSSGGASSVTFTIGAPSSIVWNWKTQYQVTFDQTGVGVDFSGTVASVDSVNYAVNGLSVSFWWDSGSSHNFSFASPLVVGSKQYVWNSTSGLSTSQSGTLTVTASGSIVGNYGVQNQVTFDQVGVGSDFTGTVVTIDSVSYSRTQLPVSFSWSVGSNHNFAFQSPLIVGANSEQYLWTSTTGLSSLQTGSITVSTYGSIVGNYKTQYYLTITSPYDSPSPVSGWFDSGSGITESVTSPVSGGSGIQYVCTGWTGTGSVPSSGGVLSVTFTINAPSTITWNWKTQYYLTVTSVYDSPSPVSGWFDSGTGITESVTSPTAGPAGTQYVCTGWTGSGSVPSSGGVSSVTFTIGAPSSIVWNWKTQYYLTVTSVYDSPSPVSGWFDSGSGITESVTSPVSGGSGIQYVCTGWTGTGSVPSSGGASSVTFTIGAPSSIVWNWKTQYQVTFDRSGLDSSASSTVTTVNGNPLTYGQLPYAIWVDSGASITYSYGNVSSSTTGKRFILIGVTGLPSPVTVASSMAITGNYKAQYQLAFSQTGVGPDFVGAVVTVDSNAYTVSSLPVSFWWDDGSSHTFAFSSPLPVNASAQYSWSSTSGLSTTQSGTLPITGSGSVTGNYTAQIKYLVTFDPGVGSDWTGPVLTVDGVNYTEAQLPVSFWWDPGSVHTFAFQSPLVVASNVKQYVWSYTTGLSTSQSGSITVNASGNIIGYYKTQYCLTLTTSPTGVDSPSGVGWYDAGTNATISTDAFVDIVSGSSRYRFNGWTTSNMTEISDPTRSPTNVSMDAGKTVTANYVAQFKVVFDQSGVGSDFTDTIVTVDLVNYNRSQLPVTFWLDNGTSHDFAFQSPLVVTANNMQYAWSSTTGMVTSQSGTLLVASFGNIVGNYKTQYYFASSSPYGSPTPANGWFDSGAIIVASVGSPVSGSAGTQYVCTGWTGTGSAPTSGAVPNVTFTIAQATSLTWNWKTQYYLTVTSSPAVAYPSGSGWYDQSASAPLTAPTVANYPFWHWDVDGTFQGDNVTTITVNMDAPHIATADYYSPNPTPSTVGGYSVSLAKQPPASYYSVYMALIAASVLILTFRKRKKRQSTMLCSMTNDKTD